MEAPSGNWRKEFFLWGRGIRTVKNRFQLIISLVFICSGVVPLPCWGQAEVVIQSKNAIAFQLQGYDGFADITLYKGSLPAGGRQRLETQYSGLAMLIFSGGQRYPLLIGGKPSTVMIIDAGQIPSFGEGDENQRFYTMLSGDVQLDNGDTFAGVMIRGKQVLDSSSSIKTVTDLHKKKREFEKFMQHNYRELSHSDLLRRLISQYFMMDEYVSYHRKGEPGGDIRSKYRREVVAGVQSLLDLLRDHIPGNKLLNYGVGLYYKRGMVTMAALIADTFKTLAHCGGDNQRFAELPANLQLVNSDGSTAGTLGALKGEKTVSFVSSACPVSMVRAVIKARELAEANTDGGYHFLIVVPLEQLSEKHRAMCRNVSGGAMLFVDDRAWVEKNLRNIRLPLIKKIPGQL